jgi:hypothetical protein
VWVSYDELGALMGCDAATARAAAAAIPLDRRRCHDGLTRAKLDAALTDVFLDRLLGAWIDRELAGSAARLRELHAEMTRAATPPNAERAAG